VDDTVDQKMLALIAEGVPARFRKVTLRPETRLQNELGLDSIAMLTLMFRFEKAFGVDLTTIDMGANLAQMRTVGDALAMGRAVLSRIDAGRTAER